jgi:hypothetical protein
MYGCTFKKDGKFDGYKIAGFPSFQVEGTVTNIFTSTTSSGSQRYDLSLDISDEACEALATSLRNSVVPHFLNLPQPTSKDEGKIVKKIKLDPSSVKIPVQEIDHTQFESEKKYWGVSVSAYQKTPTLKFENGAFVPALITELRVGDEVQVTCFLSMYDYINGKLERKTGVSIVAGSVVLEHKAVEEGAAEDDEVPPAFVITLKGQTYTV